MIEKFYLAFTVIYILVVVSFLWVLYQYLKEREKPISKNDDIILIIPKDVYEKQVNVGDRIIRIILPEDK